MALTPQTITNNIVVGSGYVMVGQLGTGDADEGFMYHGETPTFSLNAQSENLVIPSSDGPVKTNLVNKPVGVAYSGQVTFRNVSDDTLAMFMMGNKETVSQTATPVLDEPINGVQQGRYYQLGASATNPSGVKGVTAVSITDDVPNPAFTANTDYVLYADQGVIYIVPGGGITNGTNLRNDYTPVANSRVRVKSSDQGSPSYQIKFFPDNTVGANREHFIPKCSLSPNGEAQLKSRDGSIDLVMNISVETKDGFEHVYIDGVPVV